VYALYVLAFLAIVVGVILYERYAVPPAAAVAVVVVMPPTNSIEDEEEQGGAGSPGPLASPKGEAAPLLAAPHGSPPFV
jgi:hypothetical protein